MVYYVLCESIMSIYVYISLLFFFFKQKTAYEMRISDWSSDVCSSDLRVDHLLGLSVPLITLSAPAAAQVSDAELAEYGVTVGTIASEVEEIGRASCRERVCQYV